MTVVTPDVYGGAAVTSKNIYRKIGATQWTEVAGAATFTANGYEKLEGVFGIGSGTASTEFSDEPYGCKFTWTVPCLAAPELDASILCPDGGVIDDATYSDLSVTSVDPEDNTVISASATVDIDNGDLMSLKTTWQGAYQEDFGNRYVGNGNENLLVIKYNSSQYTSWYATDLNGNAYPAGTVPTVYSATSGYTARAYKVPVMKSNQEWEFYLVADATGSGKEPTGAQSNVTVYLYDANWYLNSDTNEIAYGVENEDGSDIGSTSPDTHTIYLDT